MKRKVIEAFDYAADGVHPNRLKVGRWYAFPDDHAGRFEAEGKLEPLVEAVPSDVEWAPDHVTGERDGPDVIGDGVLVEARPAPRTAGRKPKPRK